ncbi:MAG TPA: tetratricopeptide repeat protein [Haliangiales bacterium]|nr:tetratricopeptide repeat protein [Haliangiales bacterium]
MKRITMVLIALGGCATDSHVRRTQEEGEHLRVELAETYIKKGAYDAAIPLLTRAAAQAPKDAYVRTLYGTVLREKGLYPQAERELKAAIDLNPRGASAWAEMGILYDLEHRGDDAERAHRQALTLAPASASYWNNLGFSLYVAGRTDEAVDALEKSLALDPGLTVAYNNLGFAYGRARRMADAERSFRTAGGDLAALVNMAIVYERNGDADTAARLRAEAKAKDPKVEVP